MTVNNKYILICGGDVGGSRALMALIELLEKNNLNYLIVNHGYLGENISKKLSKNLLEKNNFKLEELFCKKKISIYIFSTSVKDTVALKIARFSKKNNILTFCLLDSAIRIRDRMELDSLSTFHPDFIFLQDEESISSAEAEGFGKETLIVTGQPALNHLYKSNENWSSSNHFAMMKMNEWIDNRKIILFISEPVKSDQGSTKNSPQFRGYDEENVISIICNSLQNYHKKIQIGVLPHPRDNINKLKNLFKKYSFKLHYNFFNCDSGRDAILFSDGIIGMASILIYESWLIGKPTISLQPNIINKNFLYLEKKKNLPLFKEEKSFVYYIWL